ncbi:response regulator transcription factor [Anaerotalea alkaliphila]|uniref:Stage 0 sporulation protein A homolog n=1 Tax=Anaerotalea alkaliphila TaxID=2662126 RepID=A0A7X5HXQ1_9FIRM|nr:response regulator [Anaerotalea alkaliphila]NDL68577.1 response regulator [Anaerotalea alkaliphila]
MYKVMIIDDEKSLRNLLKMTVPWESLGLEVAGEAASGIEAINRIDEIQPDIAFVDIQMPFMDGIQFSKLAIRRYPDLKIIILTAHSDFAYARECIGIGVCEYLLKPVSRAEVREVLERILRKLEAREPRQEVPVLLQGNENVSRIVEYIQASYQDPDLNLTAIAQKFGFNPSYLSRLFKGETGKSLIDYLTEWRMEKAILLARQGSLMYMTAKAVGIPDPNYFGKCFKKYTDQTYTEYVKKLKKP